MLRGLPDAVFVAGAEGVGHAGLAVEEKVSPAGGALGVEGGGEVLACPAVGGRGDSGVAGGGYCGCLQSWKKIMKIKIKKSKYRDVVFFC